MANTSPAIEDYLKTVYAHTEWQPDAITPSALAGRLGIAPSSVTEMVKKLAAAGLVIHVPYGAVRLTPLGTDRARQVVRRHRLIETWLVREMGYGWDEVHDEAEVLEHSVSDRLLEAIDERLGRPTRDPHGDPIPLADGSIVVPDAVNLAIATPGHTGRIVRISDRDPAVLRSLDEASAGLDTALSVTDVGADVIRIDLAGRTHALTRAAAEAIWVEA
ncbi:metal-dependent transcriptional regulator [Agromyces atrinae]|uniref:Manganese transport regulator n=1 Tax=Agromyces atrinae TaxID=592376 RepID=A0A4Q2M8L1_9MICO|nr:metal-dependent transcriptional regulator [Agromyces atrinae]NYD68151.1 DtxR family Mn-dependent transcriptional regulator [Agromyces atrinae]RXZ87707.1 metal-dependent transcriptional regulator [Agromyces atrinae]